MNGRSDELSLIWRHVKNAWGNEMLAESLRDEECVAFAHVDLTRFPAPNNRNVNMMPFLMDDIKSLPEDLRCYWPMIEQCTETLTSSTKGRNRHRVRRSLRKSAPAMPAHAERRVAYLTVQESVVQAGTSQRRPGLHTEGFTRLPCESGSCLATPYWHGWGFGQSMRSGEFDGGIFMASNVDDSCHVYNCLVPTELVGKGGDIEHLRSTLHEHLPNAPQPRTRRPPHLSNDPEGAKGAAVGDAHMTDFYLGERVQGPISLQANELFWMTDRTPHQSMPLKEGTRRQYFRLVAGKVDVWFAAHSTPNPLGTLPDAPIVEIDKFTGRVPSSQRGAREDASPSAGLSSWQRVRRALLASVARGGNGGLKMAAVVGAAGEASVDVA